MDDLYFKDDTPEMKAAKDRLVDHLHDFANDLRFLEASDSMYLIQLYRTLGWFMKNRPYKKPT